MTYGNDSRKNGPFCSWKRGESCHQQLFPALPNSRGPGPITLVFAQGRNRMINAHRRLLFAVPHKAGFCPPYPRMIPTAVQLPETRKWREFRALSKNEMAGFYVNRCHPSVTLHDKWCSFLQHKCGLHDKWCNIRMYGKGGEKRA